jgi:anti-sigma factor RsiW
VRYRYSHGGRSVGRDSRHLRFDEHLDFVRGQHSAGLAPELTQHLSTCTECATELHSVRRLVDLMRTDDGEDAPEHVLNRAVRIFSQRRQDRPAAGILRRIVATIRLDTARQQPAFGMRGPRPAGRHLVFNAGPNDLQVRVERSEIGWVVSGQVFGPCSGGQVLATGETARVEASLNELCEFSLPTLPDDDYRLLVRLSDVEIEVPRLQLRV